MSNDLNTGNVIQWFDDFGESDNPYAFLSNFYEGEPITALGYTWMTGEHLFQAMKFYGSDWDHMIKIRHAADPATAKAMGRTRLRPIRDDWEAVKYDVMAMVVRLKFAHGSHLGDLLLATGDVLLVEGTYWRDEVWGVDLTNDVRPGRNWLGTLLMARRAELRAGLDVDTAAWNLEFACVPST